jgi:2-(1,2-epoxy-1,2-dihydrophenyl)acetyl-CoA isomerase
MTEFLLWDEDDGIVTLTMNRPEERNALGDEGQFAAFEAAIDRINTTPSIRVAILTGAGSAFCAGGNLKDMINRTGMFGGDAMSVRRRYRAGIHRVPLAIERLEVPLIAAVNGPAMGAGCDLACMCDVRIASDRASFGEIFVKLGLIPGDGGCWFLQRAVGYAKAAEMVLTGDPISAAEALDCGLVLKVTTPDMLLEEARKLARRIAANPADAVRMAKSLLKEARSGPLSNALEMAAAYQAISHHGEAHADFLARLPKNKS